MQTRLRHGPAIGDRRPARMRACRHRSSPGLERLLIEGTRRLKGRAEALGADRPEMAFRSGLLAPEPVQRLRGVLSHVRAAEDGTRQQQCFRQAGIVIGKDRLEPRPCVPPYCTKQVVQLPGERFKLKPCRSVARVDAEMRC